MYSSRFGQAKRDTEHALRCGPTYLFHALAWYRVVFTLGWVLEGVSPPINQKPWFTRWSLQLKLPWMPFKGVAAVPCNPFASSTLARGSRNRPIHQRIAWKQITSHDRVAIDRRQSRQTSQYNQQLSNGGYSHSKGWLTLTMQGSRCLWKFKELKGTFYRIYYSMNPLNTTIS